jgi:hypothetical protein
MIRIKKEVKRSVKRVRRLGGEEVRRLGGEEVKAATVVTAIAEAMTNRVNRYREDFGRANTPKLRTIRPMNSVGSNSMVVRRYVK